MQSLSEPAKEHLFHTFSRVMEDVQEGHFIPNIVITKRKNL